jgi:integrase
MTRTQPTKIALTDRHLKALKPAADGTRQVIWDVMMPGMAVRVSALGKVSFYVVKRRTGDAQPTWSRLGGYPVMTLGKARDAAREAIEALMAGQSPKETAKAKQQAADAAAREAAGNTFAAVAEAFVRQYLPRIRSAKVYEAYVRRELIPALGHRPIAEIKRREIVALLETVAARSGESTARQALSILRKMMNWALARDLSDFESNPAAAIKVSDVLGQPKARDRLLADTELAAIWRAIDAVGEPFASVYKLLLLTGARREEIAEARWEDFNADAATLTIPAARSKTGDAMLIPLPPAAVEILTATARFNGAFVFSTTAGHRPVQAFSQAKARLDAALTAQGVAIPPFVIHDFRRALRSGLGRLGVPAVVAELCLGHRRPGIVGVYDRHSYFSEKRDALRKWEAHLLAIVEQPPADDGKVVPMRARMPA